MDKKASSLIIVFFILLAVIVVASVAGSLLILNSQKMASTSSSKAKDIGAMVSTAFITVKLSADDGSDETLENFYHQVQLQPGSSPVALSSLLVLVELDDATAELSPGSGPCLYDAGHTEGGQAGFWTDGSSGGYYTYRILKNSTQTQEGVFKDGELLELCYRLPRSVTQYDDLYVRLKAGNALALSEPVAVPFVLDALVRLKN